MENGKWKMENGEIFSINRLTFNYLFIFRFPFSIFHLQRNGFDNFQIERFDGGDARRVIGQQTDFADA